MKFDKVPKVVCQWRCPTGQFACAPRSLYLKPFLVRAIKSGTGYPRLKRPTLGGEPQRRDCGHDGQDEEESHCARRLVKPEDPDSDGPYRADSAPYRIGRPIGIARDATSSRPMLIATETKKAIVHGDIAEAIDEAQRGRETDFEQPADDQPQPGHEHPFTGRGAQPR